jgi:hypothetical protein
MFRRFAWKTYKDLSDLGPTPGQAHPPNIMKGTVEKEQEGNTDRYYLGIIQDVQYYLANCPYCSRTEKSAIVLRSCDYPSGLTVILMIKHSADECFTHHPDNLKSPR